MAKSNCLLHSFYVFFLRGFGDRLIVLKSRSYLWPVHFCIKKRNIYWSFETTKQAETYAPFWFEGEFKRVSPSFIERRLLFSLSLILGNLLLLLLVAILIIPWFIAWALYQPCYGIWWLFHGISRYLVM